MPAKSPPPSKPAIRIMNIDAKFCDQCGWMMAKVSYIDVKTKKRIRKYTCANRKCTRYNQ